jgi:hypothetical protein
MLGHIRTRASALARRVGTRQEHLALDAAGHF